MPKKSKAIAFTKRVLDGLPTPTTGRSCWRDKRVPGLCLYITPGDCRTFYLYKRIKKRPVRFQIGHYPQTTIETARKVAADVLSRIARGDDPQAERQIQRDEPTFGELFVYWRDEFATPHGKKTIPEFQRLYDLHLKKWENRPASQVTFEDVQALHRQMGKKTKHLANRVMQTVRLVYARAIKDKKWRKLNPAVGIEAYPEEPRDRFLRENEFPRLFEAMKSESEDIQDYITLLLMTGARRSNLCGMRWQDIHGDVWEIPAGETKAGKAIVIPLVPQAIEILGKRRAITAGSPWVFPSAKTTCGHLRDPSKPWIRIRKRAGLNDLRVHDLRRSLGSWAASTGASLPIVGKMLGHSDGSSATRIYARLLTDPVRAAVTKATDAMLAHVNGGQGDGEA